MQNSDEQDKSEIEYTTIEFGKQPLDSMAMIQSRSQPPLEIKSD